MDAVYAYTVHNACMVNGFVVVTQRGLHPGKMPIHFGAKSEMKEISRALKTEC